MMMEGNGIARAATPQGAALMATGLDQDRHAVNEALRP